MSLRMKQYTSADDYWHLRQFFRRLRLENRRPSALWDVSGFDYWRWHMLENVVERTPDELCRWIDAAGTIVSALVQGDPGVCHPMADPKHQTVDLMHEMLDVAEAKPSTQTCDGRQVVLIWTGEKDDILRSTLRARRYEEHESAHAVEYDAWQPLGVCPEPARLADGYSIRSMGDADE